MAIEDMFGDLHKIDILAEKTETKEVLMVLVCNGFIDGSPETQKALLDKMEGYLNPVSYTHLPAMERYARLAMREFEWYNNLSDESCAMPGTFAVFALGLEGPK